MGILLSKPDEESVLGKDEELMHRTPRKRKGGRRDGDIATTHRTRKRQRWSRYARTPLAVKSSFLETDVIIHKDTFVEGSESTNNFSSNTSDSLDLPPRCEKISRQERKGVSDDSTTSPPDAEETSLDPSDAMISSSIARRKRKASTSPYFKARAMQLSSPPANPTPSEKSLEKRSKISVIETGPMPSSLPHFRPTSPEEFGLIQEKLRHQPWKMLVAVIFLNVTTAKMALPLLGQLFERWPTPEALSRANFEELSAFLYPIGLFNTRAKRLIDFSTMWLSNPPCPNILTRRKGLAKYPPTAISHLPGMGLYALDSWRIFCADEEEWRNVQPSDKELQAWMRWRWARDSQSTVNEAI